MQRSHWHLMSQHFSQKTGVWNQYCHYRFCALHRWPAKTMEAPWRGYTPPKRWLWLVKITCGLHHMRLGSTKISSGAIHTMNSWSALAGSGYKKVLPSHHGPKAKTSRTWQCQPPKHRSALMGPALRKCSSWGKKSKTPGESSSKAIHDPTVPTHIGLMHHVSTLQGKSKPSRLYNRRHAPVLTSLISCENCISGLHHCQFYPACNQAWPVCVWRLVCQCREVIDTLFPSISAKNWCLESVLPLPILCLASLAC